MKRPLGIVRWVIAVPIGLVWFLFLLILALPVMIYMTALYYAVEAWSSLRGAAQAWRS